MGDHGKSGGSGGHGPSPCPQPWPIRLEPYYTPQKQKNNTLGNLQGLTGGQEPSTDSRRIRGPPWVNRSSGALPGLDSGTGLCLRGAGTGRRFRGSGTGANSKAEANTGVSSGAGADTGASSGTGVDTEASSGAGVSRDWWA